MNLTDLLDKLTRLSASFSQQGTAFERMMRTYLQTDPLYSDRFEKVFSWMEWPDRPARERDTGIDLVGIERDGGVCAIQCKFIPAGQSVSKPAIDSFLSASSREPFTSRLIIATTDHWNTNATNTLKDQRPPVQRLGLSDLLESPIDWSKFDPTIPDRLLKLSVRTLLPHQRAAIDDVKQGFREADRGKLIMACGTGKTFTSLRLAEEVVGRGGHVLFLVPSIALLSQALKEWTRESEIPLQCLAVCSDTEVTRDSEDSRTFDIALPATTKPERLGAHLETARQRALSQGDHEPMYVTFSTYQSLRVIEEAQRDFGFPEFDLIICDEAHRTAGVATETHDSAFVLVHDNERIKATKRIYMTATPKVYGDRAKSKATEAEVILYSMDNEAHFGKEFHRLGFGEAVRRELLSDYQVVILAIDEAYAAQTLHSVLTDSDSEIKLDDAAKLLGCWMGLAKISDSQEEFANDPDPMKTGVIFVNTINGSKEVQKTFTDVAAQAQLQGIGTSRNLPGVEIKHIDGTMGALERNGDLNWLRESTEECRLLTNAKCLSEGVDVPSLDAVMFLQPRKSQVDVVQAVGRVMRRAEGKQFGYVILPVVIPSNVDPDEALDRNKSFEVVWQILQALKAHDERFEAIINTLNLGDPAQRKINVIGVAGDSEESDSTHKETLNEINTQAALWPEHIETAIFAKLSKRLSSSKYWPQWAEDVAVLAGTYVTRIKEAKNRSSVFADNLASLVETLRENINPSISEDDTIEMLAQHMVTKPVFDALFGDYDFASSNPVSKSLDAVVAYLIDEESTESEAKDLERFYASVRERAGAAKTKDARQQLVKDLYENFFNKALKRTTDRMGIAYTPIEIVDFMLKSVAELTQTYFGLELKDSGVHVLDPFVGTGSFIVRLIELGLLGESLPAKYASELHANEILLLPYYIAAVNIESAYHAMTQSDTYRPFNGIVLTDTFQLSESHSFMEETVFKANSERIEAQRRAPITAIIGNPPYSVGQRTANDNAKNLKYPNLDLRIADTYVAKSRAVANNSLYDSYIRALRWASDRIGDSGIVCFVTNGGWLRGGSGQGVRASFEDEFDAVYVMDLRGNSRRSYGDKSIASEGGNVFEVRIPVTMLILIKGGVDERAPRGIFYHDIGDYLSREAKLGQLAQFNSVAGVPWTLIEPNEQHDWINQRDQSWYGLKSLTTTEPDAGIFNIDSNGLKTNRDPWVYNSSREALLATMGSMIEVFNSEVERYRHEHPSSVDDFVIGDETKISWSRGLKLELKRRANGSGVECDPSRARFGLHRPFFKQWLYFDKAINEDQAQISIIFPTEEVRNRAILVSGRGAGRFAVLATDVTPNLHTIDTTHVFARYRYEVLNTKGVLFDGAESEIRRVDNITDGALAEFQGIYGDNSLTKDDLFAYIYGVLHHPGYIEQYADNLTKEYPRIPWLKNYRELIDIGEKLLDLHIGYETVEPYPVAEEFTLMPPEDGRERYRATIMGHPNKGSGARGKADWDRTRIQVNEHLTLTGVPERASEWILGPRPALELFLQRIRPSVDKKSGIKNDPNEFSEDPMYVVELTKRVIRVCVETLDLIAAMPDHVQSRV
ncbi:type ISP restriction/modification enzyme [Ferrimicrobium acidiphilum]|uniref:Type I restriction enzyme EcoKI subunit R n=1 Tax=Ferrimicrobium acidiphilum DSM 19497 TaxID=1121877 RepID=A0A0D8FT05_9ACTN|nr:type ISP restriction/modification enzyme [Ferrimicrobium acidiphilum]KJE76241.1 type I restriction enzyme EcoKI subunit R [Ferrimicrobium acidiphilum DSM 19497]